MKGPHIHRPYPSLLPLHLLLSLSVCSLHSRSHSSHSSSSSGGGGGGGSGSGGSSGGSEIAGGSPALSLSNGRISLTFGNYSSGFALEELRTTDRRSPPERGMGNIIIARASWWTLTLVLPSNATAVVSSASPCRSLAHTHSVEADHETRTLALHWSAIPLSGTSGAAVDVHANWTLHANAHTVELSAFVVVPSAESISAIALWSLEFSLGLQIAQADTLYVPFLYGLAFDNPGQTLYNSPTDNGWDGAYPSSLATMQFMAHAKRADGRPTNATTSLYFAAHDTAASSKTLTWTVDPAGSTSHITPSNKYDQTATMALHYTPPGASVALRGRKAGGFTLGFPWVIGALPGDSWWEATQEYRSWALHANATWLSSGPLTERTDVPQWVQAPDRGKGHSAAVDFWLVCMQSCVITPLLRLSLVGHGDIAV